jgi:hypothetical protein
MAKAIYLFAPTAENITNFESIQNEITGFLYFQNQSVKIGDTEIKTNFLNPVTQQPILASIQKIYFCTSFDLGSYHDFVMTFDDVHYFTNNQDAENFINGIAL